MSRKQAEVLSRVEKELVLDKEKNTITVSFPWNQNLQTMKSNYAQARGRQAGVETRLTKAGKKEEFDMEMKKAIDSGAVSKMTSAELAAWTGPCHYLVNFAVFKPGSTSTPLRIVANSALRNCHSGLSVNDCMDQGPTTVADITEIIIKWRGFQEAFLSPFYSLVGAVS